MCATTCAASSTQARKHGFTETILGRRRYLPDLTSSNRQRREMAERMALNAPIQGSAADIIKVAMLDVEAGAAREGWPRACCCRCTTNSSSRWRREERGGAGGAGAREMGAAVPLDVPLEVNVGVGHSWFDAEH
jgi:DNA polymerase-1